MIKVVILIVLIFSVPLDLVGAYYFKKFLELRYRKRLLEIQQLEAAQVEKLLRSDM